MTVWAYELTGVTVQRGAHFRLALPHLRVEAGLIHAVVGANGSGKTTLLDLLCLLERPSTGRIDYFGRTVDFGAAALLAMRRELGVVLQEPYLFHRDIAGNIAYALRCRGVARRLIREKTGEALAFTGLTELRHRSGQQLSGGEKKRAALAMAIAAEPRVLLLDEPLANVDSAYQQILLNLIVRLNRERGVTVLFTTHDQPTAFRVADRLHTLDGGAVVDFVPENVFLCRIENRADGRWAQIEQGPAIELAAGEAGRGKIILAPDHLLVSKDPLHSSARNSLAGRVAGAAWEEHAVRLTVDVGVPLVVRLTPASYRDMGLDLNQPVWITFKVHAVTVVMEAAASTAAVAGLAGQ